MHQRRASLLAALDRRLWRDLGFADPEPKIVPFLPSLVVAWADGKLGAGEREALEERAEGLPEGLRLWVGDRLDHPPGPYFRFQVAHLLAFLSEVWPSEKDGWQHAAEEWAGELIKDAGWFRRLFGGLRAEIRDFKVLKQAMEDGGIVASERIWALARGAHADADPRRISAILDDHDHRWQASGVLLESRHLPEDCLEIPAQAAADQEIVERTAVAAFSPIIQDEELAEDVVTARMRQSAHIHEPERWILLAEELAALGRPMTERQRAELAGRLRQDAGGAFEECSLAELAYLEDALASDARWMSWHPGHFEELGVHRGDVARKQAPGTFCHPRARVQARVEQQLVPGPAGLGFRILVVEAEGGRHALRLASPVIVQDPVTQEAAAWIARFLPEMCDPRCHLVLDEAGRRWVAEVHSQLPRRCSEIQEPLPPGRSLLIPPWVWFRAASALGARFFAGRRRHATVAEE